MKSGLDQLFEEKVYLVIQLSSQIQEKIHQANLLHLDLKSGNILIQEKIKPNGERYYFPRIIDFGISVEYKNKKDVCGPHGTPGYMDPNIHLSKADYSSDIYSLGVVMAEIFGHQLTDDEKIENRSGVLKDRDFNLAFDPSITHTDLATIIKDCINASVNQDPKRQYSLQDIQILFQWIRWQLLLPDIPIEFRESVINASDVAQDVRPILRTLTLTPNKMRDELFNALNRIEDNSYAIAEFMHVLNIKSLMGCKTKNEVKEKFIGIFNECDVDKINHVKHRYAVLQILAELSISDELNTIFHAKMQEYRTTLQSWKLFPAKLDNMKKSKESIKSYSPALNFPETAPITLPKVIDTMVRILNVYKHYDKHSLRGKVIMAMLAYMDATLTKETILRHDRAASPQRLQDIRDILNLVQSNLSDEALTHKIANHFNNKTFSVGFFGKWGSNLRGSVLNVLKEYPIKPLNLRVS